MAVGPYPRPPEHPRCESKNFPRPPRHGGAALAADGCPAFGVVTVPHLPNDAANGSKLANTPRKDYTRHFTHCSVMQSHGSKDDDGASDALACGAASGVALESVRNGCQCCAKLRLRLQHEERARVKAQEQLAKLQVNNLQLRRQSVESVGKDAGSQEPDSIVGANSGMPNTGTSDSHSPISVDDDIARSLESYRREVSILREALRERDEHEAAHAERKRNRLKEHESVKQEWEAQVAGLVCEVQDLEAKNRDLEEAFRALATTSGSSASSAVGSSYSQRAIAPSYGLSYSHGAVAPSHGLGFKNMMPPAG